MSELIENNIDLAEVVQKYKTKGVEVTEKELVQSEEEGNLRVFESTEDCFDWIHDSDTAYEELVKEWRAMSPKDFEPYNTLFDYEIGTDNRIIELEDGQAIFLYEV